MRLALSSEAQDDIEDIYDYSQLTWGSDQAERYRSHLYEGLDTLVNFPELGKSLHDSALALRVLRIEQHNAYYLVAEDRVRVLRIMHVRRGSLPDLR